MAEKLPFFTLFESFQAPRQLRLLLHDAYVTGAVLDREARTIEVQATSGEAVPDAAVSAAAALAAASVAWAVVPATAAAVAVGGNENKKRKAVALYHCLSLFYAVYRE